MHYLSTYVHHLGKHLFILLIETFFTKYHNTNNNNNNKNNYNF